MLCCVSNLQLNDSPRRALACQFVFVRGVLVSHVSSTHVFFRWRTNIFMVLIKPVECNRLGEREGGGKKDSSTYMWTLARTHAEQSGVFFSLSGMFFFPFSFFFSQWRSLHP